MYLSFYLACLKSKGPPRTQHLINRFAMVAQSCCGSEGARRPASPLLLRAPPPRPPLPASKKEAARIGSKIRALRELVPGGGGGGGGGGDGEEEELDVVLLRAAEHIVRLRTQVEVMQIVVGVLRPEDRRRGD